MGILLDKFDKFIVEHGSAVVRGDHIALLRDQLQVAEKQIEKLEAENISLKERLRQSDTQLQAKLHADEFVKHRGALFKRKPEGGYHLAVYCPICRHATASVFDTPFACTSQCGWIASFGERRLPEIIKELP